MSKPSWELEWECFTQCEREMRMWGDLGYDPIYRDGIVERGPHIYPFGDNLSATSHSSDDSHDATSDDEDFTHHIACNMFCCSMSSVAANDYVFATPIAADVAVVDNAAADAVVIDFLAGTAAAGVDAVIAADVTDSCMLLLLTMSMCCHCLSIYSVACFFS